MPRIFPSRRSSAPRPSGSRREALRRRALDAWWSVRMAARRQARRAARVRTLRDVVGALVIVGVALAAVQFATGGAWPPLLVIESGSMMHDDAETPYGRLGSIDVGDILLVRRADPSEVELWVDGGEHHYGRPGHVISFAANGDRVNASVVHRAITYVEVTRGPQGIEYALRWVDGETRRFGPQGIYFPALGFDEAFGFTPQDGYKPRHSGFITKGDNAFSNPASDQALGISEVVDPTWVEGTVHGEVPWVGLARLALQSGKTNPMVPGWARVGNAFAPVELWSMFFLLLAVVVLVPLSIDTHRLWREERERQRQARVVAQAREERKPVEFQPVSRRG